MVGHTLASLQDVRWLPQDLDEQHTGRDTLVVVWNPFAPGCKDVFRFAQQMELRVRQNAGGRTTLDTIFLAPYCNLTWNEEKRAATRGINVSHEDEARAYAFLLKSLKVSQRCGLAPPSDPFFGQVGSDYFPAFFLVDSDRKVQLTVTGAEPEKLRYLADQIIACLKRDGESPSSK